MPGTNGKTTSQRRPFWFVLLLPVFLGLFLANNVHGQGDDDLSVTGMELVDVHESGLFSQKLTYRVTLENDGNTDYQDALARASLEGGDALERWFTKLEDKEAEFHDIGPHSSVQSDDTIVVRTLSFIDFDENAIEWRIVRKTPAEQGHPPEVRILYPWDGATIRRDRVRVIGIIQDDSEIESVTVNGEPADFRGYFFQIFNETVPIIYGPNRIEVVVTDRDGNETIVSISVYRPGDETPPTISARIEPQPNDGGWHTTPVTIIFECEDNTGYVKSCTPPITASTDGANQVFTGQAKDNSGNIAEVAVAIDLDQTSPGLQAEIDPPANPAGWRNAEVSVTFVCEDPVSGIQTCPQSMTIPEEGADQLFAVSAADVAGNTTSFEFGVSIDKTPPAFTLASPTEDAFVAPEMRLIIETEDDLSGIALDAWSLSVNEETRPVTCEETEPGVVACSVDAPLTAPELSLVLSATDRAGNPGPSVERVVQLDTDGDGVPDRDDAFPENPGESSDLDEDGVGDNSDPDRDGDGVDNDEDVFPEDPEEWADLDEDGIGDNVDTDRDGDEVDNDEDAFPDDPTESTDLDGDGIGDNSDPDRDGDEVDNGEDVFPDDPAEWADLDEDGIGDNADPDRDGDGVDNDQDEYPNDAAQTGEPPTITLAGPDPRSAPGTSIAIEGAITDPGSAVANAWMENDRFSGVQFSVVLDGQDQFADTISIAEGYNTITVHAVDAFGNATSTTLTVVGVRPPEITLLSPANPFTTDSPEVNVVGEVFSYEPADRIRILLNGYQQFLTPGSEPHVYPFEFTDVPLQEGLNVLKLSAEAPAGRASLDVNVTYTEDQEDDGEGPVLDLESPKAGFITNDTELAVGGTISDPAGVAQLTVNDSPVEISGIRNTEFGFFYVVDIGGQEGDVNIEIEAVDVFDNVTTETIAGRRDATPPRIELDETYRPAPDLNAIRTTALNLSGLVSDETLAGFSINGRTVGLAPGGNPGSYRFEQVINRHTSRPFPLELSAWDAAGNRTDAEYRFWLKSFTSIEIVSPHPGSEILVTGETADITVTARVSGDVQAVAAVNASIGGATPIPLSFANSVASGTISIPAVTDTRTVNVSALDDEGDLVVKSEADFRLRHSDDIALDIESQSPANGATGIEPNDPIQIRFNKPVDLTLVSLSIKETTHGMAYETGDPSLAKPGELVEMHRDQRAVDGGLSGVPGNRAVVFYPERDFGYGGRVFLTVSYDGEEIARSQFTIRSNPTFLHGIVADPFMEPVGGVTVAIPEIGWETTTDDNGSFGFGFGRDAGNELPEGRLKLVVNPGLADPDYGVVERYAIVERGRLSRIGLIQLPVLDPDLPFRRIASGQTDAVLDSGDLRLDLSNTRLLFPDGADAGNVHVQFTPFNELPVAGVGGSLPQWMYAVQPAGINVSGDVTVTIQAPELFGSLGYLPEDGSRVLLLGLDIASNQLAPVGTGELSDGLVAGTAAYQRLDYIGYALVGQDKQQVLLDYENGTLTRRQLISALEQ